MSLVGLQSRYSGPERRIARPSATVVGAALLGAAAIGFVTLCPIGLRPHLAPANLERFGAYLGLGLVLSQAAPRRPMLALTLVVLLAFGLEAAQTLVPGRDARFVDACVKATGGVLGAQAGYLSHAFRRWVLRTFAPLRPAPALVRSPGWRGRR